MCLFLRLSSYSKINPLHTCVCLVLARFNHVCMRLVSFKANAVLGSFGDFFFLSFQILYLQERLVFACVSSYFTELFPEKQNRNFGLFHRSLKQQKGGKFLVSFLAPRPSKLQKNGLLWFGVCSLGLWWRHSCWKMVGSEEARRKRGGGRIPTESRQVA